MKELEKFGAEIFLAQVVCGVVVYFGTPPIGADILALVTATIVAIAFSVIAMIRGAWANAAVGYSSASASLVAISLLHPEAALSSILLSIFASAYFVASAFAAAFVERDEGTFAGVFPSVLWPVGALKYLNVRFWRSWGRWVQRGAR